MGNSFPVPIGRVGPGLHLMRKTVRRIVPTMKNSSIPVRMLQVVLAHKSHIVSFLTPFPPAAIALSVTFVFISIIDIENQLELLKTELVKLRTVYFELDQLVLLMITFNDFVMKRVIAEKIDEMITKRFAQLMEAPMEDYFKEEITEFRKLILLFSSSGQLKELADTVEIPVIIKEIVKEEQTRRSERNALEKMVETTGYIYQLLNPTEIYDSLKDQFNVCTNYFSILNARHQVLVSFVQTETPTIYAQAMQFLFSNGALDLYLGNENSRVGGSRRRKGHATRHRKSPSSKIRRVALRQ